MVRLAAAGVGDRGHIGGRAGNGDVVEGVGGSQLDGLPQTRAQRLQVLRRVGGRRREERRQVVIGWGRGRNWILKKGAAGFVGVAPVITAAGSDSGRHIVMRPTAGRAAENPKRSVGVVLARENVHIQLRLGVVPPPQMQATAANKDSLCFIESSLLSKFSSFLISQKKRVKPKITKK